MRYQQSYRVEKTLAKDSANKQLSGVCAGIAKHYELPRVAIRVAALVALVTFPVVTGVAYVVAAILLPTR
ncbi:PspC domain-containing protein [Thalassotalea piscium]